MLPNPVPTFRSGADLIQEGSPVKVDKTNCKTGKAIMTEPDQFRIRGSTGRPNEWLNTLHPDDIIQIPHKR